jgi:hypothetical protein
MPLLPPAAMVGRTAAAGHDASGCVSRIPHRMHAPRHLQAPRNTAPHACSFFYLNFGMLSYYILYQHHIYAVDYLL